MVTPVVVVFAALLVVLAVAVVVLVVVLVRHPAGRSSGRPSPETQRPPAAGSPPDAGTAATERSDGERVSERVTALQAQLAAVRTELNTARDELDTARADAQSGRADAERRVARARREADEAVRKAHEESEHAVASAVLDARQEGERQLSSRRAELERREQRLAEREERLAAALQRIEEHDRELAEAQAALGAREEALTALEEERRAELERVAGLSADAARTELVQAIEGQAKREAAILVRDIEAEARETGEQRARQVVVDAIQRVASEQTAESVVSVLHLPSDEMKGRIIGREGRNIRTYESVTGVNLIIDDTPEAVLLSCFDPFRREVGRLTLEKLVLDGRIHPHRIEEVYERSRAEIDELCARAGEEALVDVGLTDLHPELTTLLGRLRYRTSYGQNVLKHLIETAHIAGIMSAELRLDPASQLRIKRCAFLHDIGKALTHEVPGSHALIGADLARKYGEEDDVVHAIEAHHNEVAPQTVEAVLTQAADACSGGRPGARRESLESYVKRLERIEEIASAKPGVERVFAMQAGREVRVMVAPEDVDDLAAQVLARDVAKQIEEELTYPGQIRVTVVRESRATEIAR